MTPTHPGSAGGGSSAGAGGSTVKLHVSRTLHLDGYILNNGANATGSNSGGGSGGSILIETMHFSGHGLISVEGGSGYDYGYGGSGGRIAVKVSSRREYSGDFVAFGGFGGDKRSHFGAGAAGTVYFTDSNRGAAYRVMVNTTKGLVAKDDFRKLLINNDNRNKNLPTVILSEDAENVFEFEEIEILNHAVLQMAGKDCELTVHKFIGDKTGLFHLKKQQNMYVEFKQSVKGYTIAPVSYLLEQSSKIVLPTYVVLLGTRSEISGFMVNVHDLVIAEGATVTVHATAQTSMFENNTFIHMTDPGNVTLSSLTIQRASVFDLLNVKKSMILTISHLTVKFQANVSMNEGIIFSEDATIESEGIMYLNYRGYPAETGSGAPKSSSPTVGYGAAHGGHGGAPKPQTGGDTYDSLYSPQHSGSGGSNAGGTGGSGGGHITWENGRSFRLDGNIELKGRMGESGNAGGGSGGSILLKTLHFSGFGVINCGGGDGAAGGHGGGGGGGRIAVHIGFSNKFAGHLRTTGGVGSSGVPSGAAGTAYLEETARGPQYADIKYDKTTNKTFTVATHRRLEVDNEWRNIDLFNSHEEPWLYTVLYEGSSDYYVLDEVKLIQLANLRINYPSGGGKVTVNVHKFLGDRSGLIHLRKNQQLFVEVQASVLNETIAPCSFRIDDESEIVLPEIVDLLGTRTWLAGRITGVQHLTIASKAHVIFMSTAQTAIIENDIYIHMTPKGNFSFTTITVERASKAEFSQIVHPMYIHCSNLEVKYQGEMYMNDAEIMSSNAELESQGIINLDGAGYPSEKGDGKGLTLNNGIGIGAGHGGQGGGPKPFFGGSAYDSILTPSKPGSGGGNGNSGGSGGAGGGLLQWNVGELIEMNGVLSLRGTDGQGSAAGGGSGGGLLIKTINMKGHGLIAVDGGKGNTTGYGGAGGRVAIHCEWRYQFGGTFDNFGGSGEGENKDSHAGAAGTTYKKENFREPEYRHRKYDKTLNTTLLEVDHTYIFAGNVGKDSPAYTVVMEDYRYEYEFDEMELTGMSRMQLYHPDNVTHVTTTVHKFIGDRTGLLHIRNNQKIYVEVVESTSNKTEAPCSYQIDDGAEIILPSEVHLHGMRTTLAGLMTGVHDLFIEDEAEVEFHSTAHTALVENGVYTRVTPQGNFSFDTLTVKKGGRAGFLKITDLMFIGSDEFKVKFNGQLYMNHAEIHSSEAWIESKGIFHFDGHGCKSNEGPGAGKSVNGIGYGASHGGYGGGPDSDDSSHPYGSVFSPFQCGSGGGSGGGDGGKGGGILLWITGSNIELNGLLSLKGLSGSSGNAGGGSGGSLLIKTTNMSGHGAIDVAGGDGSSRGGGGAGGRIAVHCRFKYSYGGKFINNGGSGDSNDTSTNNGGAAGTTFVENNLRPLQYRILKYLKETNYTYLQVDHRYVHVDNKMRKVPFPSMIMEKSKHDYEFDEMEITGMARLVIYHPNKVENISLIAHRFIGDRTGQLHLQQKQKVYVEVVESVSNVTEAPCSFIIDNGAEIILPTEVHLHGVSTFLDGMVTGVHHLYIEHAASVTVSSTAQTALIEDNQYIQVTEPGNFSLPSINIQSGGKIDFTNITDILTVTTAFLQLKYRGKVMMNDGIIEAGNIDIESKGHLSLDARGPKGTTSGNSVAGGSHGGIGGHSENNKAHGSVFSPRSKGQGGLGSDAGSGGCKLSLRVGTLLHVDGLVSSRGGNAKSGNAGGGSGGSLLVSSYQVSGHGTLDVSGGSGSGNGGGGGGGRIALHISDRNTYGGNYTAKGGKSQDNEQVGGPGAIYKYESNRGPTYRDIKYNPRLNITTIKPEHSKLMIDNGNLRTKNPAIVMEENTVYYELDEVQIEGYSYLHFYHPDNIQNVTIVIHELTGNKKGLIRVQDHQRLIINFVESTHTYLDVPCGVHVDRGGEVILPTTLIILAEKFILEGRMTGVEKLIIERSGQLILSGEAHTADTPQTAVWYTHPLSTRYTRGYVKFGEIDINNAGILTISVDPLEGVADASSLIIHTGGIIESSSLKVQYLCSKVNIQKEGTLIGQGYGYPEGHGPAAGAEHQTVTSGGGHASSGKIQNSSIRHL